MNGLIETGGGLKGAFGAGVLDWCGENGILFEYCIGVSAGAGNLVTYLAGQMGRNIRFYTDYSLRPEYMSLHNLIHKHGYFDMDYIYSTLTNEGGEDPLDYDALQANPATFKVVATDVDTGLPVYFDKSDFKRNDYFPLKASSSIPFVNRPYEYGGHRYIDGGVADPIPIGLAFRGGCDKVVVISSRPRSFKHDPDEDRRFVRIMKRRYPMAARAMKYRCRLYNIERQDVLTAEKEGRALLVAPDEIEGLHTLTRDPDALMDLYRKGRRTAEEQIPPFLEK